MIHHNITPEDFDRKLKAGELAADLIVDVREQEEWDYYHLEEAVHIPMNSIPERMKELPSDNLIYIVCAHGVRSEMVVRYLLQNGLENVVNVIGGMAAVSGLRGFIYD
ncbi:rhodanese-like domain-containing protein [Chlamydia abortus]|uniref:Rhodanese-like domain-containing protein n=1 Tax=Paenibacillus residui TaxID=629724 RepID=A0ABW3D3H8_9BACL|nr:MULTISPECIES: rhodanese-like domain-containing protein [Paenibacillaceae]SHE11062.1 rhodanese-like domain-containing protein [Chlamydia abortus]